MPVDELRVICARLPGNELARGECQNLTGGIPEDETGVAVCQRLEHVGRAAYINLGVRCLAQADSLAALAEQIARLPVEAERFRVEYLSLALRKTGRKTQAILAVADALPAYPDLTHPQHRFLVVDQGSLLWFGEILAEAQRTYLRHDLKPYRTSSSLPSRLARALVNLVAPPARSLLDPFCGTGSILLEAQAVGLEAFGMDRNPRMTGMTRRNLLHFGYQAQVMLGDALTCTQAADAIVTDLPNGRLLEIDQAAQRKILHRLVELAPLAVYLAEADISPWLLEAGYQKVERWRIRKRHGLSRYAHRAWQAA